MSLRVEVLTGARAGFTRVYSGSRITVGRHPDSDLQFNPRSDLRVSSRHAALVPDGNRWFVRDLESRNGTFVNGVRIDGDRYLEDGDEIQFGGGPLVRIRLSPVPAGVEAAADDPALPRTVAARPAPATRPPGLGVALLALVVLAGVVFLLLDTRSSRRADWETERRALEVRIDSILQASHRALDSTEAHGAALEEALRSSHEEIVALRAELRRTDPSEGGSVEQLRRRLQSATAALRRQQLAATIDVAGIEARNAQAVAIVYVEAPDGTVSTATAFAVRSEGILATARHVIAGEDGNLRPSRIGVQFAGSAQVWPARVVGRSPAVDVALLEVMNLVGQVPTVQGLNLRPDTLFAGDPVALIGFPLAGDVSFSSGTSGHVPRALVSVGIVLDRTERAIEVQGYGKQGASGSPIFDGNGEVVAILRGGRQRNGNNILVGSPGTALLHLLTRFTDEEL